MYTGQMQDIGTFFLDEDNHNRITGENKVIPLTTIYKNKNAIYSSSIKLHESTSMRYHY